MSSNRPTNSRRKKKVKPARIWDGRFRSTALATGQEAQSGYLEPRRKWDPISPSEREARAAQKAAESTIAKTYPRPNLTA